MKGFLTSTAPSSSPGAACFFSSDRVSPSPTFAMAAAARTSGFESVAAASFGAKVLAILWSTKLKTRCQNQKQKTLLTTDLAFVFLQGHQHYDKR
mmetsp:Transcript_22701/g.52208  ORF Transcript_22701/g.52208 Transcript_22701/m.52208 type:complete len:95 (+) Transcript_22701:684-968(+)